MKNDKDKPKARKFYWHGLMLLTDYPFKEIVRRCHDFTMNPTLHMLILLWENIIDCVDFNEEHIEQLMHVYHVGAKEYGDKNYLGLELDRIIDSMSRHLIKMVFFVNNDAKSGYSHMAHFLANILIAAEILSKS